MTTPLSTTPAYGFLLGFEAGLRSMDDDQQLLLTATLDAKQRRRFRFGIGIGRVFRNQLRAGDPDVQEVRSVVVETMHQWELDHSDDAAQG